MLVVAPGSCMFPSWLCLTELITSTLLLEESKASTRVRSGVSAMRPGALPALIVPLISWSSCPLMSTRPGDAVVLDTLCEARTRFVSALGDDPQDTKLKLATTSTTSKSADFFKREAPNCRKNRDLSAKYRIIAEPLNSTRPKLRPLTKRFDPACLRHARTGVHPVF
jgi:hypothetical protein